MNAKTPSPQARRFHVIPAEGLEALKHYKYSGVDNSWLANNYGRPFWNWAVNLLPWWIAPNLVTLIGLIFILVSYGALSFYCPLLQGTAPRWVYFLASFCLFVYQTLDAIDGKQARRTNTQSPLGELFDHGCDAVNGTLFALNLATTMQIGSDHPIMAYLSMLAVILPFYIAVWEEYHTGTLVLGIINVTEAQVMGMLVFFVTGVFGTDIWLPTIAQVGGFDIRPSTIVVFGGLGGGFLAILTAFYNVARYVQRGNSVQPASTNTGEINSDRQVIRVSEILLQLVNLVVLAVAGWIWAKYSPNDLHKTSPHLILATVGFLNSYLVGGFIVARVCGRLPIRLFQHELLPFCLSAAVVLFGHEIEWVRQLEWPMILVCVVHAIGAYLFFGFQVTKDFCAHLGINALTMTESQRRVANRLRDEAAVAAKSKAS